MTEISSVKTGNINNPFAEFKKNSNGYYFMTQNPNTEKDRFNSTTKEKQEEKKTRHLGKTIAMSALGAGIGILFLMRGLPKNAYKTIEKWSQKLEVKLNKQRKSGQVGKLEEFYTFTLNKLASFMGKAKSINNFVAVKDISFKKLMYQNKFTQKIHDNITEVYERIGIRTVNKSYAKAKTKLNSTFQIFEDYDEKILMNSHNGTTEIEGKTVNEWLDKIENLKTTIRRTWNKNFGQRERNNRYNGIKDNMKNLTEDVWSETAGNLDNLRRRELYETFIAEERLAAPKMKLLHDTMNSRYIITRDIDDIYKSSVDVIDNITSFIKTRDQSSRDIIKELRLKLEDWKKLSGNTESTDRLKLNEEITTILKKLSSNIKENSRTYGYNPETIRQLDTNIEVVGSIMGESGKGALQEIYTIYKKLLPREDYLKLKNASTRNMKYLDDAIKKETDSFFDMERDLTMGSAPTDILSILAAIGAIGVGLSKAENKDQQNTVLLKAGIPAVGAIATSLYFSASLVSGGKAMLYGGISGLAISKLGSILDEYRKKHFPSTTSKQNKPNGAV